MVTTIEQGNVAAGEKLLKYYLSDVENPSSEYVATAVLAVIDEMPTSAPEAFSVMVSYLRDADATLEKSIVDRALEIIENRIIEQQAGNVSNQQQEPSLEQEFAAILAQQQVTR
jgi:hypothetical protein